MPHNLLAKAIFASSASVAERRLPSPNLFNAARAGNSHSTNVHCGLRGFCNADLMAAIAALSRFAVDIGAFASPPPPAEGKLKRNNCDDDCCVVDFCSRRDVVENAVHCRSSTTKRSINERGSVDVGIGIIFIESIVCCWYLNGSGGVAYQLGSFGLISSSSTS